MKSEITDYLTCDVQVNIHTDTLNESGFVESEQSIFMRVQIKVAEDICQALSRRSATVRFIHTTLREPVSSPSVRSDRMYEQNLLRWRPRAGHHHGL